MLSPAVTWAAQPEVIEGKFTPPAGQTLMIVGQDSDTIAAYLQAVPEDNIEGVTLYTNLKSTDPKKTLKGVFETANWQAGDVNFGNTLASVPGAALAIGLAFDQCDQPKHGEKIAAGQYDPSLKELVRFIESIAPRKVFLRIGYEFDGPWNCYDPQSYKAAYRHITNAVRQADNVVTVWHSATWPDPHAGGDRMALYDHRDEQHLNNWYPGDDVVDWVGISSFYRDLSQWNYTPVDRPDVAQDRALQFARKHNKPVMIAEAAPQAYRIGAQTKSFIGDNTQSPHSAEKIWQDWFALLFDFVEQNQDVIRAVAYINTHWETQPMWRCEANAKPGSPQCPNGNWGDSRVQASPYIKAKWLETVNDADKWVQKADY